MWVGLEYAYYRVGKAYAQSAPTPLTITERLALSSLNERQRVLTEDIRAFSAEVCKAHNLEMNECSIDPQAMTITRVKPPAPKDEKK